MRDKILLLQGVSKLPCSTLPQPAEGIQGLDPVTGQRSASSPLARRAKKISFVVVVVFFFPHFSAQAWSPSIQTENRAAGVCILQMYAVPTKTAEQNPSQILAEQLHCAARAGCSSPLEINPGMALVFSRESALGSEAHVQPAQCCRHSGTQREFLGHGAPIDGKACQRQQKPRAEEVGHCLATFRVLSAISTLLFA